MNELNTKMLKKVYNLVYGITGLQFYPVGGAVRDILYGVTPKDYDMVLPVGSMVDSQAHGIMENISKEMAIMGFSTKLYQSYGINLGIKSTLPLFRLCSLAA